MGMIWIASYPRSGNTWVRHLVYHYFFGRPESSRSVNARIPAVENLNPGFVAQVGNNDLFCKSQQVFNPKHPYIQNTKAFIYITRHPKDVLVSAHNYLGLNDGNLPDRQDVAQNFILNMGLTCWMKELGSGSWIANVASWLSAAQYFPHLFLRYEDLHTDTAECLRQICRLLTQPIDEERITQAVEECDFDHMQHMEITEKEQGISGIAGKADIDLHFMHSGKVGQSLEGFGEGVDEQFDIRFGKTLSMLGYETPQPAQLND